MTRSPGPDANGPASHARQKGGGGTDTGRKRDGKDGGRVVSRGEVRATRPLRRDAPPSSSFICAVAGGLPLTASETNHAFPSPPVSRV